MTDTTAGHPYDPDDKWLSEATPEEQTEAMRRWFMDRYEDPINQTPWDGEEKRYLFVWGGPYDPDDVIQERFSGIVDLEVILELVDELVSEVGDEWAPIEHEGVDYDDYISQLIVADRRDPKRFLDQRINEIYAVIAASNLAGTNLRLLHQMSHSSLIAAFEAYLADTLSYWMENDERVLRRFVATNKDFQARSVTLDKVFERLENLGGEVKKYLSEVVWHRLGKIKPMMAGALEIEVPDIGDLSREVLVRHDIVHRAGRQHDGSLVDLSEDDLRHVSNSINRFSDALEEELSRRFPNKDSDVTEDF